MASNLSENIVPTQQTGSKTDDKATVQLSSLEEAKQLFDQAKNRLLDVNNWYEVAGKMSATFMLTDSQGNQINGKPEAGHYFKIDLPGPGTITGEGYDWVQIESVEEQENGSADEEIVAIKVRPAGNPTNDKKDVAHFFTDEATSSFIVSRAGLQVTAEVHGRNEKANTDADAIIGKTRNALIASGAKAGLSSIQWTNLVNGLLGKTS